MNPLGMNPDNMELIDSIDIGDDVVCDSCNDDFTRSDEVGGVSIGSYAVCPRCAPRWTKNLNAEEMKSVILPGVGQTFRSFVVETLRQGSAGKIEIYGDPTPEPMTEWPDEYNGKKPDELNGKED